MQQLRQSQYGCVSAAAFAFIVLLSVGCDKSRTIGKRVAGPNPIELVTVFRGPFDKIILEQGELESSNNFNVVCQVKSTNPRGTPILWVVAEGNYVKRGDRLVELDSSPLEQSLKAQRIRLAAAEANLIRSEANVRTAEISLQQYLEGTYVSERKTLLSQVALAQQALRKAELNLNNSNRLVEKGAITELQIESEKFALENAKQSLLLAESALRVLDELSREKNKVQLQSDIDAAAALLESDRLVLREEQEELKELQDQLAKCFIDSPAEGVAVYHNSERGPGGEVVIEEGTLVRERQTIIKLPDLTQMRVKALINESNVLAVEAGMQAIVTVEGVPGEQLAVVKQVNRYAEPGQWFDAAVKEYATYIELINPPESVRTGMTAEVRIFVGEIADALQIPVQSIYDYKGHLFCLKKAGNQWETVEIELGGTNGELVAVTRGLEEGAEVVLNPRQHLDLLQLPDLDEDNLDLQLKMNGAKTGSDRNSLGVS